MGKKLTRWCKNIMLVCGTITSLVGAVGSIASLLMPKKEVAMMKNIPIEESINWLMYMPLVFVAGIILLLLSRLKHD